jgi:hypothetical protein
MTTNPEHINQLAAIIREVDRRLPANYIDPEHQGGDLKLLQTFYQACHTEGGTADEIHLRGLRAVLAARPAAPSAPEPVPDKPADSLAARPLLEKLARLDDLVGINVAEVRQLADQAAAWLRANPPGQPVAIEPRGCPLPGACSCVVPGARPAPEVEDLIRCLQIRAHLLGAEGASLSQRGDAYYFDRAATLLQQRSAPAPAVAPVATDKELRSVYSGGQWGAHGPALRDVYNLGRKHGPPTAQPAPPAAPAPAVVPVAARRGCDDGLMAGVCVALATVTLHHDSVIWKEIVQ